MIFHRRNDSLALFSENVSNDDPLLTADKFTQLKPVDDDFKILQQFGEGI